MLYCGKELSEVVRNFCSWGRIIKKAKKKQKKTRPTIATIQVSSAVLSDKIIQSVFLSMGQNIFITLGGLSDPGYSLWSSLFQRCINLITMGLLKSTSWKPVTLAPPCMNLSRDMSLKPWERERIDEGRCKHRQNIQYLLWESGSGLQNPLTESVHLCWHIILHILQQFTWLFIPLLNMEWLPQLWVWLHAEWHFIAKWSWRGIHLGMGQWQR